MRIIRCAQLAEVTQVLEWARAEGWNPGDADAAAFFAADPDGFFVAEVDGQLVASISVVNHDAQTAFLGLYICLPAFRGQGHGLALWTEALRHAGTRRVGLEGVPAQQPNYLRSGFAALGRTLRFCGETPEAQAPAFAGALSVAEASDCVELMRADRRAVGYERAGFARAWFAPCDSRQTVVLRRDGKITGHATFRTCASGVKIGPFHASHERDALALLRACPAEFPAGPLSIDVPDSAPALADMLRGYGFEPVFETAQMLRGAPLPPRDLPPYYAVATLELG